MGRRSATSEHSTVGSANHSARRRKTMTDWTSPAAARSAGAIASAKWRVASFKASADGDASSKARAAEEYTGQFRQWMWTFSSGQERSPRTPILLQQASTACALMTITAWRAQTFAAHLERRLLSPAPPPDAPAPRDVSDPNTAPYDSTPPPRADAGRHRAAARSDRTPLPKR